MQLIQVVPRVRPGDGVYDCAARLARVLGERHGATSIIVEAGRSAGGARLSEALQPSRAEAVVLLHYVGYGYAARGAPLWLARTIERRPMPGPQLGVVFHELYASGRPWQSSFWLSPLQKRVVLRVARCCQFALVTREASRQWLERAGALAAKPVSVLPTFSNIGEPSERVPLRDRSATMVVWGSAQARSNLYSRHQRSLGEACRALGISKILDIGPSIAPAFAGGFPIEAHATVPADELSRILSSARCGVVVYPASYLAKSSIFAAYAAHGLVPLVLDEPRTTPLDGLVAGRHFLRLGTGAIEGPGASLQDVASQVHAWYARHTTAMHADAVWHMLRRERP